MTVTVAILFLGALLVVAGIGNYSLAHLLRGEQVKNA